jgi:uncharacterized protein YjbI with pentapeptide repeats
MRLRERDIVALGPSSAASLLWRLAGQLHITCVLKASFEMRADAAMVLSERKPAIVHRDVHRDGLPTNSLVLPADDAPYLSQADIVFVGQAFAPDKRPVPRMRVRLAVHGRGPLIDKALEVVGQRDQAQAPPAPFERMPIVYERAQRDPKGLSNPVGLPSGAPNVGQPGTLAPDGFGPISRHWRPRRELVAPQLVARLDAPVAELPARLDWSYFQAAPADQRTRHLKGTEWVLLEGLTEGQHRMRSRLPSPRATMWAWSLEGDPAGGWPIRMVADSLYIDGNAKRCIVSWRGAFPIQSEDVLRSLGLAGGIETAARPIDWKRELNRITENKRPRRVVIPVSFDHGALGTGAPAPTMIFDPLATLEGVSLPGSPSLPFAGGGRLPTLPTLPTDEEHDQLAGTLGIATPLGPATPFQSPDARGHDSLTDTVGIATVLNPQSPTPFDAPVGGRARAESASVIATPFDRPASENAAHESGTPDTEPPPPPPEIPAPAPLEAPPIPAPPPLGGPPIVAPVSAGAPDAMTMTLGVSGPVDPTQAAPFPLPAAAARPVLVPAAIPGAPWAEAPAPTLATSSRLGATVAIAGMLLPPQGPALELPKRQGQTVRIENDSSLTAVTQAWELEPGRYTLTVVVKGSFHLAPDAAATPFEESDYPLGDQWVDDDPSKSLVRGSDYAVLKPRADVTLAGSVHPLDAQARRAEVRFAFGDEESGFDRRLAIFGERRLEPHTTGDVITKPEPFECLALRYEHAFGGEGYGPNPVGRGYVEPAPPAEREAGEVAPPPVLAMPLVEAPDARMESRADRPAPAGFGPIALGWEPRCSALGTFDEAWLEDRWPFFPADFDPSFFQHAPQGQQLPYLHGNEPFRIEGMHAQHPVLEGKLPRLRARLCAQARAAEPREGFREHPLALDTVHFDVDAMRVDLVWRAQLEVQDTEASELAALFVTAEPLEEEPATQDALFTRFLLLHGKPKAPAGVEAANDAAVLPEVDADLAQAAQQRELALATVPEPAALVGPQSVPAVAGPNPSERAAAGRREVERRLAEGGSLAGARLAEADLSDLDLSRQNLAGANLIGARLCGTKLRGSDLSQAQLSRADLSNADLTTAKLDRADLTGARLDGALLEAASLVRTVFDGTKGGDCCFINAQAGAASFVGAELPRARFAGAALDGADFSDGQLEAAVLDGASLRDAKFYDARAVGSSWVACDLTDLRAEGAVLDGARLHEARAAGSMWEGAVLDDTRFDGATLDEASFVGASAQRASYRGARLKGARFKKASLQDALFTDANLMKASFASADLTRADFSGANLHGVESWRATLDDVRLAGALLTKTKLAPDDQTLTTHGQSP